MKPSPVFLRVTRRLFGVLAACLLTVAIGVPVAVAKGGLENAQHNLAQAQKQAKTLGNQISHTRARVQQIQQEIAGLQGEIKIAEAEYQQVVDDLAKTQAEQDETRAEYDTVKERMNERARTTFERGPGGSLEFLLGATSLADLSARQEFIVALQAQDANTSNELQNLSQKLKDQAEKQKALKDAKQQALSYLQDQRDKLASRQSEARGLLSSLQRDLAAAHRLEKKWQHKVQVIVAQQSASTGTGGPSPFDVCPVPDHTWIANDFGAPRVGHTHQGNDIGARYGAEIVAPFEGSAKSSSSTTGGTQVYVYGQGGYVFNAHLSKVGQMGHVNPGDVIGYVGTSGNASSTAPHDHFEWHPGGGSAVDPYAFLMAVC